MNARPLRLSSPAQTRALGIALGRHLAPGDFVALKGELGAGKTLLVRGTAEGAGVPKEEHASSPTFALVHEYASPVARVVHCDLYRLESLSAVESLGLDDVFADCAAIVLVEWPDRAGAALPTPTLAITLEHLPDEPDLRRLTEVWPS